MARIARRAAATGLLLLVAGCAATEPGGHFDPAAWGAALRGQLDRPDQLAIELGLLTATAVAAPFDHQLQQDLNEDQSFTHGSTTNGDGVAVGLGVLAVGTGIGEWIGGDGGHATEVLLESFILTDGLTELLKHTVRRDRPGGDGNDSFPSGHTSFAFSMATFLQRRIADCNDGWIADLSYLAYAPAAYVGIDRMEANRHWPTDVAFGAFLGVLCTNVVYDAHYGTAEHPGLFGVHGLSVEPVLDPDRTEISLVLRF
ncbi:MAG: phosphatase PAP2 family protein [Planctomycetes bacterium]|nr:phosphatase PAP2 family protein [Planctomycetota bacterium]MCB9885350.1 phosphatase PAP2 family protein [Planctomycetota bacterium]